MVSGHMASSKQNQEACLLKAQRAPSFSHLLTFYYPLFFNQKHNQTIYFTKFISHPPGLTKLITWSHQIISHPPGLTKLITWFHQIKT